MASIGCGASPSHRETYGLDVVLYTLLVERHASVSGVDMLSDCGQLAWQSDGGGDGGDGGGGNGAISGIHGGGCGGGGGKGIGGGGGDGGDGNGASVPQYAAGPSPYEPGAEHAELPSGLIAGRGSRYSRVTVAPSSYEHAHRWIVTLA